MKSQLLNEYNILASYMHINQDDVDTRNRYEQAVLKLQLEATSKEYQYIQKLNKSPWMIQFLDGGLALLHSNSNFRKRLILLSAIKETQPTYINDYISSETIPNSLFKLIRIGIYAGFTGLLGILILKFSGWKL
jgi:hypothetical protein